MAALPTSAADFETGYVAYQKGDFEGAAKEWLALAKEGHTKAQYNLGILFDQGKGVVQDRAEAVRWWRRSAESGFQMAQHNLEGCDLSWIKDVKNCLLIRDPKYVMASYGKRFPVENEHLLGYLQQVEILSILEKQTGETPPILDAKDILQHPESMLKQLCNRLRINFSDRMLSWPAGKRDSDGVWAPHWYSRVEQSTGFMPYQEKEIQLNDDLIPIYKKCMVHYNTLYKKRLRP